MAKSINYLTTGDIAKRFNLGVSIVQRILDHEKEIPGSFRTNAGVRHVPEHEAGRLFDKYKDCLRLTDAAAALGMNVTSFSKILREPGCTIKFYRPTIEMGEADVNSRACATFVDMPSARAYLETRKKTATQWQQATSTAQPKIALVQPTVRSTPTPSVQDEFISEIKALRASIDRLTGTVSALAASHTVQGESTNALAKQVQDLATWLGELAVQKAQ